MTDTGIAQAPQYYRILIYPGDAKPDHPDLSTLRLELEGPFPTPEEMSAYMGQHQQAEFKPGDDITINSGDILTWKITDPTIISSILILHKEKGKNVFASGPAPVLPGTDWSGTVRRVSKKEDEEYAICWSQDGKTYCFDPKITVNP